MTDSLKLDEKALEVAAKACRDITFNALTMDECKDACRSAITAYLAATPAVEPAAVDALRTFVERVRDGHFYEDYDRACDDLKKVGAAIAALSASPPAVEAKAFPAQLTDRQLHAAGRAAPVSEEHILAIHAAILEFAPVEPTAREVLQVSPLDFAEAKIVARKAIYDDDGCGMIGRNRNYLEDRVARALMRGAS